MEEFSKALGSEEEGKTFLKDWAGFAMVCPDLKDGKDLFIKGSKSSMRASVAMLEIRRCDNKPSCYGSSSIDSYIEDLQVDTYVIYNKVNF